MVREVRFGWDEGMSIPDLSAREPDDREWEDVDLRQSGKSKSRNRIVQPGNQLSSSVRKKVSGRRERSGS